MEIVERNSKDIKSLDYPQNTVIGRDPNQDGGTWKCFYCQLEESYDYKGTKPPFAKHLLFSEDCYIMRDPFNPLNSNEILVLGAHCNICNNSVCIKCSLFFAKRFCKICALKNIEYFPLKFQNKILCLNQEQNDEEI